MHHEDDIELEIAETDKEKARQRLDEMCRKLLANMVPTGKSPVVSAAKLKAFGFSIAIGAALFTMIQHLTGSAWSVPVRRIMENIMMTLPVGLILFLPVAFGAGEIYPWMNQQLVNADPVLFEGTSIPNADRPRAAGARWRPGSIRRAGPGNCRPSTPPPRGRAACRARRP